jgi:hypothetical protein
MKTLQILFLGLLATALTAKAQDSTDPWLIQPTVTIPILTPDTNATVQAQAQFQANTSSSSPGYAEATCARHSGARRRIAKRPGENFQLRSRPHQIRVFYYGSMKGAATHLAGAERQ